MKCHVLVKDMRCRYGLNTRTAEFDTVHECIKWAERQKNVAVNRVTILASPRQAYSYAIVPMEVRKCLRNSNAQ